MSESSARQFILEAGHDVSLNERVLAATGPLTVGQITMDQHTAATAVARQAGYDFTADDLQRAYDALIQEHTAGQTEAQAEPAEVAGHAFQNVLGTIGVVSAKKAGAPGQTGPS
jgi:hypothetical protein